MDGGAARNAEGGQGGRFGIGNGRARLGSWQLPQRHIRIQLPAVSQSHARQPWQALTNLRKAESPIRRLGGASCAVLFANTRSHLALPLGQHPALMIA